jgi:hypothetical protein
MLSRSPAPQGIRSRSAVLMAIVLCACALNAAGAWGQSGPLPGSGYTATYSYNCGVLHDGGPNQFCFSQGTRSAANASYHTYGWGSADYDGTNPGSVLVCTNLEITGAGNCDYNYARACVYPPQCNDPGDSSNWRGRHVVWLASSPPHTVNGKAKA